MTEKSRSDVVSDSEYKKPEHTSNEAQPQEADMPWATIPCPICDGTGYLKDAIQAWDSGGFAPECPHCTVLEDAPSSSVVIPEAEARELWALKQQGLAAVEKQSAKLCDNVVTALRERLRMFEEAAKEILDLGITAFAPAPVKAAYDKLQAVLSILSTEGKE